MMLYLLDRLGRIVDAQGRLSTSPIEWPLRRPRLEGLCPESFYPLLLESGLLPGRAPGTLTRPDSYSPRWASWVTTISRNRKSSHNSVMKWWCFRHISDDGSLRP